MGAPLTSVFFNWFQFKYKVGAPSPDNIASLLISPSFKCSNQLQLNNAYFIPLKFYTLLNMYPCFFYHAATSPVASTHF